MATDAFSVKSPSVTEWGNYFTNGLRIGAAAPTSRKFSASSFLTANGDLGQLDQFGSGVNLSPIFTYRIRPGQCQTPMTFPDITQFQVTASATTSSMDLSLLGPGEQPNAACAAIQLNGKKALLFDVPRTIMVACADTVDADYSFNLYFYGLDYYFRPKTCSLTCNIQAQSTDQTAYFFATLQSFMCLTGVKLGPITTTSVSGVLNTFSVYSDNCFGLPYRLDQAAHLIQYSQSDETDSVTGENGIVYNVENSLNYPRGYTINETTGAVSVNTGGDTAIFNNVVSPFSSVGSTVTPAGFANNMTNNGAILCGANYRIPQQLGSVDPCGLFRPNTWITKETPGTTGTQTLSSETQNFVPGSTLTFTYYVAGADFYPAQNLERQTFLAGGDVTLLTNLGYREYYEPTTETFGVVVIPGVSPPPPFTDTSDVQFINGIPDPFNVESSKGIVPYYFPQSSVIPT